MWTPIRTPLALALLAVVLVLGYAAYLAPEWEPAADDQADYIQLAHGLASRGEFTRAGPDEPFVAEPHRRPGYPLVVAVLCRTVGCGHWQIAGAGAVMHGALVLLTFHLGSQVLGRRGALVGAAVTALYLPLAYYGALALSEMLSTLLLLGSLASYVEATRRRSWSWALTCGALCGALALTRPVFVFLPAVFVLTEIARGGPWGRRSILLATVLGVSVLIQAPFLAYALQWSGGPLVSNSGMVLWHGYLQGRAAGTAEDLDQARAAALAEADEATIVQLGARLGLDRVESTEVAAAFRDVAAFEAAPDRAARIEGFVVLNRHLRERSARLIAHDPWGWIGRGLTIRTIALSAGDVPLRAEDRAALPAEATLVVMSAQIAMALAGGIGAIRLARERTVTGWCIALAVLGIWLLSIPFLGEGRYAIPARPLLAIGLAAMLPAAVRR